MKFNVGDKVRIKVSFVFKNTNYKNKEGTITKVDHQYDLYQLDILDNLYLIPDMLELVEERYAVTEKCYQPKHAKETFKYFRKEDDKIQRHEKLCAFLNELYIQKNEKYGDSFGISVRKYGLISALTRMSDKWNRLEQLILNGDNGTEDETLKDTLIDLSNYCLMTVLELDELEHE